MRKFFLLTITTLILAGCSTDQDTFAKKKECQELYDQAKTQVESKWENVMFDPQIENPKVYYSPKLDSCIYYSEVIQSHDWNSTIYATYYLNIIDLLNNGELVSVVCDSKTSLVSEKYNNIPQKTSEDLEEFSQCTSPIDQKLKELEVKWFF